MSADSFSSPRNEGVAPDRSPGALRIAQEASEWVARCDRGLSDAEQRDFAAWRRAHPQHEAELARIRATWSGLDHLASDAELGDLADAVFSRAQDRRRKRRTWWRAAVSVSLAAAAAIAVMLSRPSESAGTAPVIVSQNVQVLESTLKRQELPDGSVAELNGASRVEVDYSARERRVRLSAGEAHFVVRKSDPRPFYVSAGPVTVRAVGTAFDVRLDAENVEVLVTEGKVSLQRSEAVAADATAAAPVPVAAMVQGQRAVIARAESADAPVQVTDVAPTEVEEALGWQNTRLSFNNTPLDEVVAGFNRYNRHQLTLGDAALRQRRLTGIFRADNLDGFVRLLRSTIDVKAEQRNASETVLLPLP